VAYRRQVARSPRTFDPELTHYRYPRAVGLYEFRGQDQDLRMAYMFAEPERSNGQTVLLLHGKLFSGAYWEPTIQALLKEGCRVLVPDQIGFGNSSKPDCYQFTFHALAHNTRGLLDHLDIDRVHVVGHSMGGMLGTRFALMFPDAADQLALVNPIGLEDWKALGVPYRTVDQTTRTSSTRPPRASASTNAATTSRDIGNPNTTR
jgi:pimeloyl-ACP methyl ester carboxylesterase